MIEQTVLINTKLGDLNSLELAMLIDLMIESFPQSKKEMINESVKLATILHSNQTRKSRNKFIETPYIEHPLRNTARLLKWGIKDADILVSSMLHDVVEDSSISFCKSFLHKKRISESLAREQLSEYIEREFNINVKRIVLGVTNDMSLRQSENKNEDYKIHVTSAIYNDPQVFLVKLSDFVDNAVGLWHSSSNNFVLKQSYKYLPMIDVFQNELDNLLNKKLIDLNTKTIVDIKFKLKYARENMQNIIKENEEK